MNVLRIDFQELYRRHLCRHSQFGINVVHVVSVLGTYVALYGLVSALAASEWMLLAIIVPYLTILAFNIPLRVFLLNALFVGLLLLACLRMPPLPFWCYLLLIILFYKLQAWSHKIYTRETDMTEFDEKYRKGARLFVLLSIYELPILLNYLFFGKRDWYAHGDGNPADSVRGVATTLSRKG
jgi:hypothetical protein